MFDNIISSFPDISFNARYFLIKTNNGQYYREFIDKQIVFLYPYKEEKKRLNLEKEIKIFTCEIKVGDMVIIPSWQNKFLHIGKVSSESITEDGMIYRMVNWIKTMETKTVTNIHQFLYLNHCLISLNGLKAEIERNLFPYFYDGKSFHLIINVGQKTEISCRSLYGFYDLLLHDTNNEDLKIKMQVQSPGLIELIMDKIDVLLVIIKVIKIIYYLVNKAEKAESSKKILEENQDFVSKYYDYGVDKLELKAPNIEHISHRIDKY